MAFIGYTNGDSASIAPPRLGLAPPHGSHNAQAAADMVTNGAVLDGVLEAYRACLRHNGVADESS